MNPYRQAWMKLQQEINNKPSWGCKQILQLMKDIIIEAQDKALSSKDEEIKG